MLKLLIFAPCDRAIVGDDKLVSIIVLLETINLELEQDEGFPVDAIYPMDWNIVTLWRRTESVDGDITFEQRVDLTRADGEVVGGGHTEFTLNNRFINYRTVLRMKGFPVGVEGECPLKLFYRRKDAGEEWQEIASYPLNVKHKLKGAKDGEPESENAEVG